MQVAPFSELWLWTVGKGERELNTVAITHCLLAGDSMWTATSATPTITSWDRTCFWTADPNKSFLTLSLCVRILSQRCWRWLHSELHSWRKYKTSDADDLLGNKAQSLDLLWHCNSFPSQLILQSHSHWCLKPHSLEFPWTECKEKKLWIERGFLST